MSGSISDRVPDGAQIILYRDDRATYLHVYRPGGRFECHHGLLDLPAELHWGDVLRTRKGVDMAVLRPTHALTLNRIKRRTTVVYNREAGRIALELGVRSGGRYGEVGSGSGAMTTLLASLVGDGGRVYSREREPEHLEQARKNIARAGLSGRVDFELRDVASEGFGVTGLDGVFVDVPAPWDLVPAAHAALSGGAPWVSLSPTVDQIVRTDQALFRAGFVRRRMIELFEREWKLFPGRMRPADRMVGHTAFLLVASKVNDATFAAQERPR
ncbi:MAG: methyltransferase domain-containing protein [Candidatus Dadabacteria bacterium]|nr:MAG: methyltransferase domain-containing protein [Candidatus Dadabacteria bacterium]